MSTFKPDALIRVADAQISQAARLEEIAIAAYQPYIALMGRAPAPLNADYRCHIQQDRVLVLFQGEQICGYAILLQQDGQFWLDNIAIDPDVQSKGYGRMLIEAIEEIIRPQADFYQLYTNIVMDQNIKWYQRLGFVQTKTATIDGYHRIYFKKQLF